MGYKVARSHCEGFVRATRQSIHKVVLVKFYRLLQRLSVLAMTSIAISSLTACASYPSKFICPDAKGLNCEMLHSIDKKIDTGTMDSIYSRPKCMRERSL